MRLAALSGAFVLALGLMAAGTYAHAAALIGVGAMVGTPSEQIVKAGDKKERKQLNKACGAGKVFVEGKGCVKRENKEKAEKKATPAPAPAQEKQVCTLFSVNGTKCE